MLIVHVPSSATDIPIKVDINSATSIDVVLHRLKAHVPTTYVVLICNGKKYWVMDSAALKDLYECLRPEGPWHLTLWQPVLPSSPIGRSARTSQEQTPGSRNGLAMTPSEYLQTSLHDCIEGVDIYLHGDPLTHSDQFVSRLQPLTVDTARSTFNLPSDVDIDALDVRPLDFSYDDLYILGETKYQNILIPECEDYLFESHRQPEFFFRVGTGSLRLTAKVDGISTLFPGMIEMKEDPHTKSYPDPSAERVDVHGSEHCTDSVMDDTMKKVLGQAIERIDCLARVNGTIEQGFVFALTGKGGFMFHFQRFSVSQWRARRKTDQKLGSLRIYFLGRDSNVVNAIWNGLLCKSRMQLNNGIHPFYFTPDASMIIRVLSAMGLTHSLCRIKPIGASMSTVYGVTLMDDHNEIDLKRIDFCIKVIRHVNSRDEAVREVEISSIVAKKSREHNRHCYLWAGYTCINDSTEGVLDWWTGPSDVIDAAKSNEAKKLPHRHSDNQGTLAWWLCQPPQNECYSCAAIVMEMGVNQPVKMDNLPQLLMDIPECLSFYHSIGLLHRDARVPNMVLFNKKYQLIDFGMAAKQGEKLDVDRIQIGNMGMSAWNRAVTAGTVRGDYPTAGDADSAGSDIVLESDEWSVNDDFEMLFAGIANFIK